MAGILLIVAVREPSYVVELELALGGAHRTAEVVFFKNLGLFLSREPGPLAAPFNERLQHSQGHVRKPLATILQVDLQFLKPPLDVVPPLWQHVNMARTWSSLTLP